MSDLKALINRTRESRELKRALAVQNTLAGRPWKEVVAEWEVCESFIGKWRHIYQTQGGEGLKLGYKGSSGYLTAEQRTEVIGWLQHPQHWNVGRLRAYLQQRYGVVYQSRQSYYELLHEAKLSWKKSQKRNPKADPDKVKTTRDAIKKNDTGSGAHSEKGNRGAVCG
jgi:putative transposase